MPLILTITVCVCLQYIIDRGAKSVEYWKHIGVRGSSNSVSNICLKLIKLYLMTLNYRLRGFERL